MTVLEFITKVNDASYNFYDRKNDKLPIFENYTLLNNRPLRDMEIPDDITKREIDEVFFTSKVLRVFLKPKKVYELSEEELYTFIEHCTNGVEYDYCDAKSCPLFKYCEHFLTGDDLEEDE